MAKKLALLHTSSAIIKPAGELAREIIPEVDVVNVVDESILTHLNKFGRITPQLTRKIANYVISLQQEEIDVVLFTCSSISPCADLIKPLVNIPVIKIDEAMIEKAIGLGQKIGVVATLATTLNPTKTLLQEVDRQRKNKIIIKGALCNDAFNALIRGQLEEHDELVLKEIRELSEDVEVIVLN